MVAHGGIMKSSKRNVAEFWSQELARQKFLRTHEFRQVSGDEQQIECRLLPNGEWEPYAYYKTRELADSKFTELTQEQLIAAKTRKDK